MIIFFFFFFAINVLMAQIFGFVYANTTAIYSLLALLIFGAIAMMFIQETRRYSGVALIIAILLYAAVEILAPYTVAIGWIISAIVAVIATVSIKRPMLRMVRRHRQTMPTWCRIILSIV